eukprot:6131258-Pyramimonas_sp.AAC.1
MFRGGLLRCVLVRHVMLRHAPFCCDAPRHVVRGYMWYAAIHHGSVVTLCCDEDVSTHALPGCVAIRAATLRCYDIPGK